MVFSTVDIYEEREPTDIVFLDPLRRESESVKANKRRIKASAQPECTVRCDMRNVAVCADHEERERF